MRIRYLIAFLLTTGICFSQAPNKKAVGCIGCFSEPQSTLLFSGERGDLILATPNGNLTVPHLPGWIGQYASPLPAISPSGDRVAWSLKFMLNADIVKCDPSKKGWCDLTPKPIYKSVMGVYSVRDKTWKQYGDFCSVGSAAFSPDGEKVAFAVMTRPGNPTCVGVLGSEQLMILDLGTGQMTPVPGAGRVVEVEQLSWSPDGSALAVPEFPVPETKSLQVGVIRVGSGTQKVIAEGTDPSWSPKGDWIAYIAPGDQRCVIIHPDGTGARTVLDAGRRWGGWGFGGPVVWSPEEDRLLLNESQIDGPHQDVKMVDLATGQVTTKSKNGQVVMGWVTEIK